jgi:hypothetical protein
VTIDRAFELINNLDVREPLRPHSPQWSTVVVSRSGDIADVIRHSEKPNAYLHRRQMDAYPQSMQFTAWPGRFATIDDLEAEIRKCVWTGAHF